MSRNPPDCHPALTWPTGRYQLAEDGYRGHAQNAAKPNKADYLIGMADGLPRSGAQRVADGVVAFARDGHESPGRDGNGSGCGGAKQANCSRPIGRIAVSIACIANLS